MVPLIAVALLVIGLILASRRLVAFAATAALTALLVGAVALAVPWARHRLVGDAATDPRRVAGTIYDALAAPLVNVARLTAVILLVLATAVGFLAVRRRTA